MSKTPHDLLIGESYKNKEGEDKTNWIKVGVAFPLEKGGFSCKVVDGVSLSGDFLIKERKAKDTAK